MFKTISNAFKLPDLRKKLLFTLLMIIVFRIGSVIPVPFLDMAALQQTMTNLTQQGSMFAYLDTLSGGAFANATLFAMGVTPYINSSIIIQLLSVAIPYLERLAKEGEEGRKKLATITRYTTVILGLIQGIAFYVFLYKSNVVSYRQGFDFIFAAVVIVLVFTAGTALMMWMGEQINQYGIGNGISILLFAGIIARFPLIVTQLVEFFKMALQGNTIYFVFVPLFVVIFLGVMWIITFMNDAERRIPIQYAKRVVGRKMYGGQSSHLPIKVALGGVLPIIFASSILSIPSTIRLFNPTATGAWAKFLDLFRQDGWLYAILYFIMIILFAYFYTSIQYNPIEMSNNLRQNNGTIPGIRPGKPTSDFIAKILSRITLIGALFLAVIAIVPIIYGKLTGMSAMSLGGTSIIIVVGVCLETVKQMESQMMMRHYKGFLD
ncbi:MAG: preprotein translocase subunit SecY [Acutalibacteraceae bacterium]|nr:preprotein translocase subunit SecY [Acutalibacteraceae bacterium]